MEQLLIFPTIFAAGGLNKRSEKYIYISSFIIYHVYQKT